MAFTLRQIEVFVEAAKDQNFRRTADRLGISQPAISRHIHLLEQQAGGKLFVRERGSNARLAPLGQEMLVEARALLRTARKVDGSAQSGSRGEVTLRVAAGNYLLDHWIRPNARRMLASCDGLNLEFSSVSDFQELLRQVGSGEVDCGFYTGQPPDAPGIAYRALRSVTISLYASPAMGRQVRTAQDVAALPFVLTNKGSKAEEWQLEILRQAGIVPSNVRARSQFMEVFIDMVLDGTAVALLFDSDVRHHVDKGQMVRLPVDLPAGTRLMVSSAGARRDPRKEAIIDRICALLQAGET